jgi:hypothetical protein
MMLPSGASAMAWTSPSRAGTKPVSIAPVAASKAKMLLRVTFTPPVGAWTVVNWPPATTLPPTGRIASTLPSMTCGVVFTGLALTITLCGTLTAAPGCAHRPTRAVATTRADGTIR